MKRLTLSDAEILHLSNFFKDELIKAQARIESLTSILAKLGQVGSEEENIVSKLLGAMPELAGKKPAARKPGRPRKVATKDAPAAKKPAPKRTPKVKKETTAKLAVTKPEATPETTATKAAKVKTAATKTAAAKKVTPKKVTPKKVAAKKVVAKPAENAADATTVAAAPAKAPVKTKVSKAKPKTKAKTKTKPTSKKKPTRAPLKKASGEAKISWNDFVLETLAGENTPLLSSQMADRAIAKFGIDADMADKTKMVVAGALTKLLNTDKKIAQYKVPRSRGKLYCLPTWFTEGGELKEEYRERIQLP